MTPRFITYEETAPKLSWLGAVDALRQGHMLPKAELKDSFLGPASGTLLSRAAYIEGLGFGVKSVTVFGDNPKADLPSVQGAMLVFEPEHGVLEAVIESKLVTEFKTAADSVLGATWLARGDSKTLLILGAGTVARSLVRAYSAVFPSLKQILIWSRRPEPAVALAREMQIDGIEIRAVADLEEAVGLADIISTATMARAPILKGEWIKAGTHVDLIGAFKADMREADDALMKRGSLFVDSRDTTINHIGELMMPIASGAITEASVLGDFYDLCAGRSAGRRSDDEITVFKNGGGAHLDLMMARYIVGAINT